jgi:hypothetical protein
VKTRGGGVAKIKISATELVWIFQEKLRSFDDRRSLGTYVAIVPSKHAWTVVMNARRRKEYPGSVKRIEKLQKELQEIYTLARD